MIPPAPPDCRPITERLRSHVAWAICLVGAMVDGGTANAQTAAPRFVQEIPGGGEGILVKCDLQHRFFDETYSVTQFVTQAANNGCRVVFVAPPQPSKKNAQALAQFLQDVKTAGKLFPAVLVIPAFPWLIRSGEYSDWAMVILPPGDDFPARFAELTDRLTSNLPVSDAMGNLFDALFGDKTPPSQWPAVIFTQRQAGVTLHRWAVKHHSPQQLWSLDAKLSPGQRLIGHVGLLDRWDSYDIRCSNEWDQLLADGWNAWAAADGIDVDVPASPRVKPGAFTETWLRVPELTPDHVVQAIKHGAFFGVRGQSARDVELKVTVPGLPRPGYAGETIDVPVGTPLRVELSLTVAELDWRRTPNRLDGVELIAVTPERSRIVRKESNSRGRVVIDYETVVPEGGVLFRALGYRDVADGPNYGFFTNPVRVIASGRWAPPAVEIPPEPWLRDETGLGIAALMVVLSLSAVGGWLGYTGKFQLLFGDVLAPVRRRWRSYSLRGFLHGLIPWDSVGWLAKADTLGTVLSEREILLLRAVLIGSGVVLGAVWACLIGPNPFAAAGNLGSRLACGAVAGGAVCGLMLWHPFLGVSLFLSLRMAGLIWTSAIPSIGPQICLTAAILGLAIHNAVRTGTLRWPEDSPCRAMIAWTAIVVALTVASGFLPGMFGPLAGTCAATAMCVWMYRNADGSTSPPFWSVACAAGILAGVLLAERGSIPLASPLPGFLAVLAEAIGVAILCRVARPEPIDAVGIVLIGGAIAAAGLLWPPAGGAFSALLAAGVASVVTLLFLMSDAPSLTYLSLGLFALVLGRLILFSPATHGSWLVGSAALVAASLASRHRIRALLFLSPYVIVSACLSIQSMALDATFASQPTNAVDLLVQREFTAIKQGGGSSSGNAAMLGQILSLVSLTMLSVPFGTARKHRASDEFDAAGRAVLAGLLLAGALWFLGTPLGGAAGALMAGVAGVWASHLRPDVFTSAPGFSEADLAQQTLAAFRRNLAIAAAVVAGLIAYGSLVPFHWRDVPWWGAVQEFLAQFQREWANGLPHAMEFNSDRLINVVLTVPLAFCVYGSLVLGGKGVVQRLAAVAEAWQLSVIFSILVELAQHWSTGRVASVYDVLAQALGAAIGIAAWAAVGEWFTLNVAAAWQARTTEGRAAQLLWAYLPVVLMFAVLPVGMPVTSPKQLYDHFRDGKLSMVPFADCVTWGDVLRDAVAGMVLFIPAGMWGAIAFRRAGQPLRSVGAAALNGTAFAALITVLRCLFSAEMTDSSWILTGAAGSAIGAAALHVLLGAPSIHLRNGNQVLPWWIGGALFGLLIAGFFLHPWRFDAAPEQVAAGWKRFVNTPFAGFHSGQDWLVIEEVVRKLGWFGALGLLLGHAVRRTAESRVATWLGIVVAVLLGGAIGAVIEIGQLHQTSHTAEITDVFIGLCGTLLGLWLRLTWLDVGMTECRKPTASRAPVDVIVVPPSPWSVALQTILALGLVVALLSGVLVLFLRG